MKCFSRKRKAARILAASSSPTKVEESSCCYDSVSWALDQGITTGKTATTFAPNATCTRGQIVTFLHRAMG